MTRLVEFGHAQERGFVRGIFIPVSHVETYRQKYNNVDVFTSALEYCSFTDRDAPMFGPLTLDLDLNDRDDVYSPAMFGRLLQDVRRTLWFLDMYLRVPKRFAGVYFSGSRGFHVVVPCEVFGSPEIPHLNQVYRTVARDLVAKTGVTTLDLSIYKRRSLLRLPGSRHGTSGCYKVPLTLDEVQNPKLEFSDVRYIASRPRALPAPQPEPVSQARMVFQSYRDRAMHLCSSQQPASVGLFHLEKASLPCFKALFANGVTLGARNKAFCHIVALCRQTGCSFERTLELLQLFNQEKCHPPERYSVLLATARSVYYRAYTYGCRKMQDDGFCVGEGCPHSHRYMPTYI